MLTRELDDETWIINLELEGPKLAMQGVSSAPAALIEALGDLDNSAAWDTRQVSSDEVFPMQAVGSQVMLCTYPLDGSLQVLSNCTIGSASGTTSLGTTTMSGSKRLPVR